MMVSEVMAGYPYGQDLKNVFALLTGFIIYYSLSFLSYLKNLQNRAIYTVSLSISLNRRFSPHITFFQLGHSEGFFAAVLTIEIETSRQFPELDAQLRKCENVFFPNLRQGEIAPYGFFVHNSYFLTYFLPKKHQIITGIVADYHAGVMAGDWNLIEIGVNVTKCWILLKGECPAARAGAEAGEKSEKNSDCQ